MVLTLVVGANPPTNRTDIRLDLFRDVLRPLPALGGKFDGLPPLVDVLRAGFRQPASHLRGRLMGFDFEFPGHETSLPTFIGKRGL